MSEPKAQMLFILNPQIITHTSEGLPTGNLPFTKQARDLKECSRKKKMNLGDFSFFPLGPGRGWSAFMVFFFFFFP